MRVTFVTDRPLALLLVTAAIVGLVAASCPPKSEPPPSEPEVDTVAFLYTTLVRGKLSPECPVAPCPGMQFRVCMFAWLPQDTVHEFLNFMPDVPVCDSLFKSEFEPDSS